MPDELSARLLWLEDLLGIPADDMLDEIRAWYLARSWDREEQAAEDKGLTLEEFQELQARQREGMPPDMPELPP